jgi:predicted nucleic acid-binding protein
MAADFFDTNVLLYLASPDREKAQRAEEILSAGGTISVQVLNEMANVCRRKMQLSWNDTRTFLGTFRELLVVAPVTIDTHVDALTLAERYRLAVYDALIVAAALRAECRRLWSEDMQNGMRIGRSLRIVNPFTG